MQRQASTQLLARLLAMSATGTHSATRCKYSASYLVTKPSSSCPTINSSITSSNSSSPSTLRPAARLSLSLHLAPTSSSSVLQMVAVSPSHLLRLATRTHAALRKLLVAKHSLTTQPSRTELAYRTVDDVEHRLSFQTIPFHCPSFTIAMPREIELLQIPQAQNSVFLTCHWSS